MFKNLTRFMASNSSAARWSLARVIIIYERRFNFVYIISNFPTSFVCPKLKAGKHYRCINKTVDGEQSGKIQD